MKVSLKEIRINRSNDTIEATHRDGSEVKLTLVDLTAMWNAARTIYRRGETDAQTP